MEIKWPEKRKGGIYVRGTPGYHFRELTVGGDKKVEGEKGEKPYRERIGDVSYKAIHWSAVNKRLYAKEGGKDW